MARRTSIVEDLLEFPWWLNVILAGIVYFVFKYWLPSIAFENPIFKGIAPILPKLAIPIAALLLFIALASAFKSLDKSNRTQTRARRDSVVDNLLVLPWWASVILAAVVYLVFKYWLPSISAENPLLKGMAPMFPSLAILFTGLLLFIAFASAFNSWRKGTLLESQRGIDTVRDISWREFEELVGEAYRRRGYAVAETGGGGADGGVDLVLSKGGERILVQCKHWKAWKVSVKVVRELFGVISAEGANGGILIASGTYTQEAKEFAKANSIELVDGAQLMRLIAEVQRNPKVVTSVEMSNLCPICGAEMVLRTARKGANAGNKFWGCSTYPSCRGTKKYAG